MILKVLLILVAVFAIFWTIKTKKIFPGIISLGMIVGIILTLFFSESVNFFGFYIYMGFVVLAFIFGIIDGELELWSRTIITLMSASIFLYWLWILNHWHGNTLLFPIFVLLIGLASLITKAKLKNQLGFLSILFVDAIAIILEAWMKMS